MPPVFCLLLPPPKGRAVGVSTPAGGGMPRGGWGGWKDMTRQKRRALLQELGIVPREGVAWRRDSAGQSRGVQEEDLCVLFTAGKAMASRGGRRGVRGGRAGE